MSEGSIINSDNVSFLDKELENSIEQSLNWLLSKQKGDGHWAFELEADATIPSEYIFLNHFLNEVDSDVEKMLACYLRSIQGSHGGWPLYHDGDFNMSASVKAYFALKLVGDNENAPHMVKARKVILQNGGAAKANVFTRITLALFEQVPWSAVPVMRPEAMLLPSWSPFHINKVSYWSRTVMVPLFIICAIKPKAHNPRRVSISELFQNPPFDERNYMVNPTGHWIGEVLLFGDGVLRKLECLFPKQFENRGIQKAIEFIKKRLNGKQGLGAIFPAMANTLMAFKALGYSNTHPDYLTAREAIDRLLVFSKKRDTAYCQPCLSPVWDTGLALHAIMEAGLKCGDKQVDNAAEWLINRQILDVKGDWVKNRKGVSPGGWAFQYQNNFYPDVDDTAVVVMALHRANPEKYKIAIEQATDWIIGMQSKNGGWGAFDADNEYYFLQHIPFADHGALLDPPTADVTARCLSMLAQIGYQKGDRVMARALHFLREEQESDGSWFGRWGNNYVYGTWSVLCSLNALNENPNKAYIRKAVDWLKGRQRSDGGWGEDCGSYWQHRRDEVKSSTPSQTAWAVLGLIAAGEIESIAVEGGIRYLTNELGPNGVWQEKYFNAVGFPRVFYLRYHGYSSFFPLWTLARYKTLKAKNRKTYDHGM